MGIWHLRIAIRLHDTIFAPSNTYQLLAYMPAKKVLIIRFSSIGDIVLCSPVVRSLKKSHPDHEIHFLSKPAHKDLLLHNPHIDKVHLLKDSLSDTLKELKAERISYVLDLHHNLRSMLIKLNLRLPSRSFPKKNFEKLRMVWFKDRSINLDHIVLRYGKTLELLGSKLDEEGLDFFLPEGMEAQATERMAQAFNTNLASPLAIVLGAKHMTKRWIPAHFATLLNDLQTPVVLLGGPDAKMEAEKLSEELKVPYWNTVGAFSLLESAAIMKQCNAVVSHDTGFMHIAAAFKMQVYSIWGNTVPEFGMWPYKTHHELIENKGLACRPCSKIGHDQCPKGHFKCMTEISPEEVAKLISS